MKPNQFTPGPWDATETSSGWVITSMDGGGEIADLDHWDEAGSGTTTEATARLIAAAPELLAALQLCCGSVSNTFV